MFKSKYIVIEKSFAEVPVVFSDILQHADVARALGGNVVGAGFCFITPEGRYKCYGESISCRVASRTTQDSAILNQLLGVDEG